MEAALYTPHEFIGVNERSLHHTLTDIMSIAQKDRALFFDNSGAVKLPCVTVHPEDKKILGQRRDQLMRLSGCPLTPYTF